MQILYFALAFQFHWYTEVIYFPTSLTVTDKPAKTNRSQTETSLEATCNKAAQHLYFFQRCLRKYCKLKIIADPLFAFAQLCREISCSPCHRGSDSWLMGLGIGWELGLFLRPPLLYLLVSTVSMRLTCQRDWVLAMWRLLPSQNPGTAHPTEHYYSTW